jgi:hypothetical protein
VIAVKRLMRMLGARGNPQGRNRLDLINHQQKAERLHFESERHRQCSRPSRRSRVLADWFSGTARIDPFQA